MWSTRERPQTAIRSSSRQAQEQFRLRSSYLGLTAAILSRFVDVDCVGLLGADILGRFDFILDAPRGMATISTGVLEHSGPVVDLEEFMGIPLVWARIHGIDYRMFLDTGAQISYLPHDSLASFPPAGRVTDFYPGVGQFEVETHNVDITVGGVAFTLRSGALPQLLGATLMMAETDGIIGNAVFSNRPVGYFPRRRRLVLGRALNAP